MPAITHPATVTRIFHLLGHLIQLPVNPDHIDVQNDDRRPRTRDELPSKELQGQFWADVVLRVFIDATELARAAGATDVAEALGSPKSFLAEFLKATREGIHDPDRRFQVAGFREWAKLMPVHKQIDAAMQMMEKDMEGT